MTKMLIASILWTDMIANVKMTIRVMDFIVILSKLMNVLLEHTIAHPMQNV